MSLERWPTLCPCTPGAQLSGLQQGLAKLGGSALCRPRGAQALLSLCGLLHFPWETWQGFCSKNLSQGIPDLRPSISTPSPSAVSLQLC